MELHELNKRGGESTRVSVWEAIDKGVENGNDNSQNHPVRELQHLGG